MFRLRVLSLHPAASAIGRVFIQGMGRHTSGVVCQPPSLATGLTRTFPGPFCFGSAVCCAQSQQKSLNRSPSSPSPPLLRGSQHRSAGNTGAPTRRARSFAAGLRDAITAAANHRSDSHRDDDTCHATAQHFHQAITTRCPSNFRQIAGLRYTFCQLLPAPFYLPSSNNI